MVNDIMSELRLLSFCYWLCGAFALVLRVFSVRMKSIAAYGKLSKLSQGGLCSRGTAFTAFYIIGLGMCAAITLCFQSVPFSVLGLYTIHVTRRLLESLFVHKWSSSERMRWYTALAGTSFYVVTPLSLALSYNTTLRLSTLRLCVCVVLFLTANVLQYKVHKSLAALRPDTVTESGRRYYFCPPFRYILFPHYSLEVVLYSSLALMSPLEPLPWCITLWTLCNLGITASEQRKWYERNLLTHAGDEVRLPKWNLVPFVF